MSSVSSGTGTGVAISFFLIAQLWCQQANCTNLVLWHFSATYRPYEWSPPSIERLGSPLPRWFSTYLNQLFELAMSFRALEPTQMGESRDFTLDTLVHIPRTGHLVNNLTRKKHILSIDPIKLRSGSSFPADSAKPVPLAVVSLDSR